jgi:DNA-binding GntR family transcriptional regulator
LRQAILDGALAPGTKLVERKVAAMLGVSTVAVREAFVRLNEEGLIDRIPRRGAFVATVTPEFVLDVSRVRLVLEQLAVELALQNWNGSYQARGQKIVDEMSETESTARLWELDEAFHAVFAEAAGSETLQLVLANLRGRIAQHLRRAWRNDGPEARGPTVEAHQVWLDAVGEGDVQLARRLVHEHITSSADDLVSTLMSDHQAEHEMVPGRDEAPVPESHGKPRLRPHGAKGRGAPRGRP